MALEPIAQFRGPENNLLSIMTAGQNAITGILDRAIAQGRDRVNNATRQSQNLVENLRLSQGLSQRRADNLDASILNRRNFNESVRQADRTYDLLSDKNDFAQEQQLFQNEQAIGDQQMQRETLDVNRQNSDLTRQRLLTNDEDRRNYQNSILGIRERELQMKENPQLKAPTPAELRAQEDQAFQRQDRAAKGTEQMVLGDQAAFPPQMSAYDRRFEEFKAANPDDPRAKDIDTFLAGTNQTELQAAKAYDKNQYESEVQSAKNAGSAETYANLLPGATPAIKKKRMDFYNAAVGSAAPATQQSSALQSLLGPLGISF